MSLVPQSSFSNNESIKRSKSQVKRNDTNFPGMLMQILSRNDVSDIITWMPNGRSFMFLDPDKFTNEILPNYFRKSKFTSFVRKLYRWGFRQIRKGPDSDSYFHLLFQREKKCLLKHLSCSKNDPSHDLASSLGVPPSFENMINSSTEERPKNNTPVMSEGAPKLEVFPTFPVISSRAPRTSAECTQFNYPMEISSTLRMEQEQHVNRQDIQNVSSMIATSLPNYNLIYNPYSLISTNIPNYTFGDGLSQAQATLIMQNNINIPLQDIQIIRQQPS